MVTSVMRAMTLVVMALLQRERDQPFDLGVMSVTVTAPEVALSPVTDHLDQAEIRHRRALTVSEAIAYLPGVSVDHKAPRNQTGVSIGGFDGRQVPLYLDGAPAYVPYDGYVDLTRYLTGDIAQIQVAKGYSSPLLGPNVMGGAVNLVTRQPQKPLEGEAFAGTAPGGLFNAGAQLGTRRRLWFAQGSADRLQSDFYGISQAFPVNARQPDDRRTNSSQQDQRYRVRAGWTPSSRQAFVVSYVAQRGISDVPPYAGSAPPCPQGNATTASPCVTPRFWRWPKWDVDSLYLNARAGLGNAGVLRLRAFASRYANTMAMFDDATYSSMNVNANSGTLDNRDRSVGASGEFEAQRFARQAIGASFFVKTDTHVEQTTTFSKTNLATTTPEQTDRDRQSSFGIQDTITVSSRIVATAGASIDHLNALEAQDLSADRTQVVPFPTDDRWAFNPVGSIAASIGPSGTAFVTAARKSRFPTIKDRYSYRAGRALPNPYLRPERANTWTAGYSRVFASRTVAQVDVFHSRVSDGITNIFFLSPLCSGGGRGGAGSCQQAVNVGRETRAGINLTLRTTPAAAVTVDANYSYLHRRIRGSTGAFPTGTPVHKGMASGTMRLPRGMTGIGTVQYQSGAVGMSDNGLPLPANAFATIDLAAVVPIATRLTVQGGVKNLLDRDYYYWEGFPEPGRNGYVTLRFVF
jgi:iron complex outermembrane recepter protein